MSGGLWRRFTAVAAARGAAPALIQGDAVTSFAELADAAGARAGRLAAAGMRPGGRCLFWAPNGAALAAAMLGAWRAGGIAVLVNDEAPAAHLAHAARTVAADVALVAEPLLQAAAGVDCPVLPLEGAGGGRAGEASTHDLEPASVFFTSGSSGLPKGVTQTHATLMAGCDAVAAHIGLRADDRILCPIPWAFDYGYGQLLSTLLRGVAQVLPEARNPFALCEAIERHRPTVLAALPSMLALLLRGVSPIRETDTRSLRLVTNTGGRIAAGVFDDLLAVLGHCELSLNYGMTETYRGTGLDPALARTKRDSVGRAIQGVSVAVVREDGTEAAAGEVGEIVHRGLGVFAGYWGDPEATARVRRPDPLWRHAGVPAPPAVFSGDLGRKDDDGLLYVRGRRDRLIKSMGVRVSPDEVEALLRESGLVRDAVVVGLPHEMLGEVVAAAVETDDAPGMLKRLKHYARGHMSAAMQPRHYELVAALPLTPNGKPDVPAVRTMLTARLAATP